MKQLSVFLVFVVLFSFNLIAQDMPDGAIIIEGEDFIYNEDPDSTWGTFDDEAASGGKYISEIFYGDAAVQKSKNLIAWQFETTAETDTIYYAWYLVRVGQVHDTWVYTRTFFDMEPDISLAGPDIPFTKFKTIPYGDHRENPEWYWVQQSSGINHDSLNFNAGTHVIGWRQYDTQIMHLDKIVITNDLTWQPIVTREFEAESGGHNPDIGDVVAPLYMLEEIGASEDTVVATTAGSGTISNIDMLVGNCDVPIRMGEIARGEYYMWMLVDLPTEDANTYWIGKDDEAIIPPSWEGAVTSGYEWRQLTDESGVTKMLSVNSEDYGKLTTVRIKQQEEGTKIDKILLTNDPDLVPGGGEPGEKTTIIIEAEDYYYNEDPTGTWYVKEDAEASGGKYVKQIQYGDDSVQKNKKLINWEFEVTSATDTNYMVWYLVRHEAVWANFFRTYVNFDSDTTIAGPDQPFQAFQSIDGANQIEAGDYSWRWHQQASAYQGISYDTLHFQPGKHTLGWRQFDNMIYHLDKIMITNDLDWAPEVMWEFEAESGASNPDIGDVTAPLFVMEETGASSDTVVATTAGSGTISNLDMLLGNCDVPIRMGQIARGEYFMWMLVDLPSVDENTYWIGKDEESIIPPSWEGDVTSGYQWRLLTDDSGETKLLPVHQVDFSHYATVRIKQQEEGTKIDKILLTNDPDFVPEDPVGVEDENITGNTPQTFSVAQNYPNPFNPTTVISYAIPKVSNVSVSIYNTLGQKVAELINEEQSAGNYKVNFNASNLSSGIYFYTVKAGDFVSTRKMLLLK